MALIFIDSNDMEEYTYLGVPLIPKPNNEVLLEGLVLGNSSHIIIRGIDAPVHIMNCSLDHNGAVGILPRTVWECVKLARQITYSRMMRWF